jgi:hypothetical protein
MRNHLAILSLTAISAAQNVYSGKADGLSAHTIYMPTNAPGKIPVLIWGSGGCMRDGKSYSEYFASRGRNGSHFSQVAINMGQL